MAGPRLIVLPSLAFSPRRAGAGDLAERRGRRRSKFPLGPPRAVKMAGPGRFRAGSAPTAPYGPRGFMLAPKAALPPPEQGPAFTEAVSLSPRRRPGESPLRAPASNRRSAGCPLLARHAEPNPDRKAERTPELRDGRPQLPPLRPERRPSPNFPAAAPLVSAPPHEYLYGADPVSALGPARQSQETGRGLLAPRAQPPLRPSEGPQSCAVSVAGAWR